MHQNGELRMKHLLLSLALILSASTWSKAEMCVNYLWEEFESSCPKSGVKFIEIWDKPKPYDSNRTTITLLNKDIETGKYMTEEEVGFNPEQIASLTKTLEEEYGCPNVTIEAGYRDVSYSRTALETSRLRSLFTQGYTSGKEYFWSSCGLMLNGEMYFPKWGIDKHYD